MTANLDWSDPARLVLRDGRRVLEVLKTDVKDPDYPVVALVQDKDPEREGVYLYTLCGAYTAPGRTHSFDILMREGATP